MYTMTFPDIVPNDTLFTGMFGSKFFGPYLRAKHTHDSCCHSVSSTLNQSTKLMYLQVFASKSANGHRTTPINSSTT